MKSNAISWRKVPLDEFSSVTQAWDDINRRSANLPIQDSDFFSLLLKHFYPQGGGRVVIGQVDGHSECAGILCSSSFGIWNTYQPSQAPLGGWVSTESVLSAQWAQGLVAELGRTALILGLTQLDPSIQSRPKNSLWIGAEDYIDTARLSTIGDFKEYWEQRGKNLRTNLRKQRNRLRK